MRNVRLCSARKSCTSVDDSQLTVELTLWTKAYSLNRGPGRAQAETTDAQPDIESGQKQEESSGETPLSHSPDGEETQIRGRGGETPFSEKTIVDADSRDPSQERKVPGATGV